ncbi:MAG TPA: cell division protein SepF [Bacillales bacterium]|nr:cell division protein SepF [Bacillales bacterium]
MGLMSKFKQYFDLEEDPYVPEEEQSQSTVSSIRKKNVVKLESVQQQSRVVLREPKSYEEVQRYADELKNHRAVVMNLQWLSRYEATRIIDFLSGTVYALDGDIQKLGPHTFLCTPNNIDVSGVISELGADARNK